MRKTENNKYDCGICANKRTYACDACRFIQFPSGAVAKPSCFVRLSDKEIHTIGLSGDDIMTDIAVYITRSAELCVPIPVSLIERWNKITEPEA